MVLVWRYIIWIRISVLTDRMWVRWREREEKEERISNDKLQSQTLFVSEPINRIFVVNLGNFLLDNNNFVYFHDKTSVCRCGNVSETILRKYGFEDALASLYTYYPIRKIHSKPQECSSNLFLVLYVSCFLSTRCGSVFATKNVFYVSHRNEREVSIKMNTSVVQWCDHTSSIPIIRALYNNKNHFPDWSRAAGCCFLGQTKRSKHSYMNTGKGNTNRNKT